MSFNGLRLEYTIKGTSNFIACNDRMEYVIDDNGVLAYNKANIPKLAISNAQI